MRVFISWSAEPSRSIARALADWLGGLVQVVEPWVSDDEIGSGQRWRDEVASVLNETDFGIICLTRENQHNPWLMFESGALAKRLSSARVVPLYIDLEPAEVTGPLADWQGRPLDHDGMWRIVSDINKATDKQVAETSLQRLFERMWPDFEADVAAAKACVPSPASPRRSVEEMLEEIVERVRRMEQSRDSTRLLEAQRDIDAPALRWPLLVRDEDRLIQDLNDVILHREGAAPLGRWLAHSRNEPIVTLLANLHEISDILAAEQEKRRRQSPSPEENSEPGESHDDAR